MNGEQISKNGLYNGVETWFYENGQAKSETNQNNDKLDGLSTWWYENGQKKAEANYKDGKEDGLVTWWHENSQKKSEGNWKGGKQEGVTIIYDENGKEILRRHYLNGAITLEHTSLETLCHLSRAFGYRELGIQFGTLDD